MTEHQKEKFEIFYREIIKANEYINLTSIIEKNEVEIKHFKDSLSAEKIIKSICNKKSEIVKVIDIGTGAGFPSIPLAIMLDNVNFTLVETVGKKVNFLLDIKNKIELENIEIKKIRIEDLEKTIKYDVAVSRAVALMPTLLEYCLPFVKMDGFLITYKGSNYLEELESSKNALEVLGGKVTEIKKYNLELNNEVLERNLIIIKKIKETSIKYPRGGNKPRVKPL